MSVRESANLRGAIAKDRHVDHKALYFSAVRQNQACSAQKLLGRKAPAVLSAFPLQPAMGIAREIRSAHCGWPCAWGHRPRPGKRRIVSARLTHDPLTTKPYIA